MTDAIEGVSRSIVNKTNALLLAISKSRGRLDKVAAETTTWKRLCEELANPVVDSVTMKKFLRLPVEEQHKRKNVGYIVGGTFREGKRKKPNLIERTLLTFDIDKCSPAFLDELLNPMWSPIAEVEYMIYSTRSHTDENPRVRIIIPLAKPIPPSQYDPLMRILSFQLDHEMETVDPVSFRLAQVMYLPSVCRNAPFIAFRNETGVLLNAEKVLDAWPQPWREAVSLPVSPREASARRALDKAPDPRLKKGLVGAWCRIHDIHSLIANALSDVYQPGSEPERYSFIDGHTRDGAVVYDDGTYLYSHHGTDPCASRLVNSWDLYRIHKFGHLDTIDDIEVAEGDITKLPSSKAMIEHARTDEAVVRESTANYYDEDAILADMLPDEDEDASEVPSEAPVSKKTHAPADQDFSWRDKLKRYETSGKYLPTVRNIAIILRYDPRLKDCLWFNQLNQRPVIRKRLRSKFVQLPPIRDRVNGDGLTEQVIVAIRMLLEGDPATEGGYDLKVSERDLHDAIQSTISRNQFHPIRDYLRGLKWDGKPRMRQLLATYFGAADTPLHEAFSRGFMVGAVQRAMEPGAKFDYVLILQGDQGIRKSGGLRALAGEAFFGELTTPKLEDRVKVVEQLLGKWIIEIPELSQFNQSEVEVIKALLSAQEDYVRLPWGRSGAQTYPRQNVFGGTSNKERFLKDDTGNRRFWPVHLPKQVDTAAIERDRDQLWAEAFTEYLELRWDTDHKVLPLHVPERLMTHVASAQEEHLDSPLEWLAAKIESWLDTPVPEEQTALGWRGTDEDNEHTGQYLVRQKVCLRDIAEVGLGYSDFDGRAAKDIVSAMRSLPGWFILGRKHVSGGGKQTVYARRPPLSEAAKRAKMGSKPE